MKIIIGCSWAVGEWDNRCSLAGPGFGQLLMLHDTVINLGLGAASNTLCLDRLENFLNQYRATTDDDVYWVVTCPTRCQNADWFLDKPYLSNAIDSLLYQSLSRASDLSIKHNIKIHLIGGLCDLDTISTKTYPQLDFVVPSWGRLLDKNYYCTRFMPDYWIELGTEIKKKQPNLLLEWLEMSGKISMKKQSWDRMSKSYFKTDRSHPDRDGHKKLRDHLWPQFAYKF